MKINKVEYIDTSDSSNIVCKLCAFGNSNCMTCSADANLCFSCDIGYYVEAVNATNSICSPCSNAISGC